MIMVVEANLGLDELLDALRSRSLDMTVLGGYFYEEAGFSPKPACREEV